jgi:hypothetical protein
VVLLLLPLPVMPALLPLQPLVLRLPLLQQPLLTDKTQLRPGWRLWQGRNRATQDLLLLLLPLLPLPLLLRSSSRS